MSETHSSNTSRTPFIPRALTIAGSDSGGGAGIQADLKTFSALGCYGMTVVTALTAQNTRTVAGIHGVPPDFIREQMESVLNDIGTDAVKIGMLHSSDIIQIVAQTLKKFKTTNIVLDPVMVAKSGDRLIRDDAIAALKQHLIPMATLITPNLPEAEVLTEKPVTDTVEMEKAGHALLKMGPAAVLIKGGHLVREETSPDCLVYRAGKGYPSEVTVRWFSQPRIKTKNNHGTGCTLSSAVASGLARGVSLDRAVDDALHYLNNALKGSADWRIGQGHGPVHHFHRWWS